MDEMGELGKPTYGEGETLLGGEYEMVSTQKRGTLFIEARIRDDLEEEVDAATVLHPIYNAFNCSPTDLLIGSKTSREATV